MPFTYEINGRDVEFQNKPSESDIDEAASSFSNKTITDSNSGLAQEQALLKGQSQEDSGGSSQISEIIPGLARGVVQGGQGILETGTNAAELLSKLITGKKSSIPGLNQQFLQESKQGLDQIIPPTKTFTGALATGVGRLPAMIAEFENPLISGSAKLEVLNSLKPEIAAAFKAGEYEKGVSLIKTLREGTSALDKGKKAAQYYLAAGQGAINAQDKGVGGMAIGALEGAGSMALLQKAQTMKNPLSAAIAGGAIQGIPAALHGASPNDILAQATLGAGFAMYNPKTVDRIMDGIKVTKDVITKPSESFQNFWDKVKQDRVEFVRDEINSKQTQLKREESGVVPQSVENLRNELHEIQTQGEQNISGIEEKITPIEEQLKQLKEKERGIPTQVADRQKSAVEGIRQQTEAERAAIQSLKPQEVQIAEQEEARLRQQRQQDIDQANQKMADIQGQLPKKADAQAQFVQKTLEKYYQPIYDQFGKRLTETAEKIDKNSPVSQVARNGSLIKLARKIEMADGNNTNPVLKQIQKKLDKYSGVNPIDDFFKKYPHLNSPSQIDSLEKGGTTDSFYAGEGNPRREVFRPNDPNIQVEYNQAKETKNAPIPFREVYADFKDLIDSPSADLHTAALARHSLGEIIGQFDPTFKEMNREYGNIVNYRSIANSIFKVRSGDAANERGQKWFEQFAEGKQTPSDERLLRFLEAGYQGKHLKMDGMGNLSSDFRDMGQRLEIFRRSLADLKDKEYGSYADKFAQVAKAHAQNMEQINIMDSQAKEKMELAIEQAKASFQQEHAKMSMEMATKKEILQNNISALEKQIASEKENIQKRKESARGISQQELAKTQLRFSQAKSIIENNHKMVERIDRDRKQLEGTLGAISMGLLGAGHYHIARFMKAGVMFDRMARTKGKG